MDFPHGLTLDQKFAYALALAQERRDAKRKAKGAKPECRDKPLVSKTGRVVKPATIPCGSVCRQKQNCKTSGGTSSSKSKPPRATKASMVEAVKTAKAKKTEAAATVKTEKDWKSTYTIPDRSDEGGTNRPAYRMENGVKVIPVPQDLWDIISNDRSSDFLKGGKEFKTLWGETRRYEAIPSESFPISEYEKTWRTMAGDPKDSSAASRQSESQERYQKGQTKKRAASRARIESATQDMVRQYESGSPADKEKIRKAMEARLVIAPKDSMAKTILGLGEQPKGSATGTKSKPPKQTASKPKSKTTKQPAKSAAAKPSGLSENSQKEAKKYLRLSPKLRERAKKVAMEMARFYPDDPDRQALVAEYERIDKEKPAKSRMVDPSRLPIPESEKTPAKKKAATKKKSTGPMSSKVFEMLENSASKRFVEESSRLTGSSVPSSTDLESQGFVNIWGKDNSSMGYLTKKAAIEDMMSVLYQREVGGKRIPPQMTISRGPDGQWFVMERMDSRQDSYLPNLGFGLNPNPFHHPLWDLMGY